MRYARNTVPWRTRHGRGDAAVKLMGASWHRAHHVEVYNASLLGRASVDWLRLLSAPNRAAGIGATGSFTEIERSAAPRARVFRLHLDGDA